VYNELSESIMNGETVKIITSTSQICIYKYEILKRKLYNFNANIHCNMTCIIKQLTLNYPGIKIPNISTASKRKQHKASKIRINAEL